MRVPERRAGNVTYRRVADALIGRAGTSRLQSRTRTDCPLCARYASASLGATWQLCDDATVKRSTAISRLSDVLEGLDRAAKWPETTVTAAFVYGGLLEGEPELDRVELAFVVAEPAEAVPWMARPARLDALAAILRFTKLPLSWRWRPAEWPVWNHEIERALRVWNADGGRDQAALDALATRQLDHVTLDAPASTDALIAELLVERDVGRRHLTTVTESFYDRDWQREHRGDGVHAEDHLWWASAAFLDLDDAIQRLSP
jgi:hypothetical protein